MDQSLAFRGARAVARVAAFIPGIVSLVLAASLPLGAQRAVADQPGDQLDDAPLSTRDLHVWGRFGPGTWKQVRIITEALNERGEVTDTTTTETKTTLLKVDDRSLRLKIDVTVEVGGKRFAGQTRVVEHGYFSEQPSEPSDMKLLGAAHVTIDGQRVPCQIRQVVARRGQRQQLTKLYLSEAVEPFVLKRETTALQAGGEISGDTQTIVEVIALDMPYRVKRELKSAAYERTIHRTPKGATVTLDVTCVDVPGGIVARTSKELDEKGRLVRRSTLELVDYQTVLDESPSEDGPRYLTRRQARRAARRGR